MRSQIFAGDSLDFTDASAAHSAADGWVMSYRLVPRTAGTPIEIACVTAPDGTSHRALVPSGTSDDWAAGQYTWFQSVAKAGERITLASGSTTISPNPAVATTFDGRSDARKTLDALKAAYQSYATAGQGGVAEYSIGGRTMKFRNAADLIAQIRHWERVVADEDVAARVAAGQSTGRRIFTRFMS